MQPIIIDYDSTNSQDMEKESLVREWNRNSELSEDVHSNALLAEPVFLVNVAESDNTFLNLYPSW